MKLKFTFAILAFLTASIVGTAMFFSYLTASERRALVDLRLETYFERLREIDFTDKSADEIEEADTLGKELKSAGLVWVWKRENQQFFGGAKSFGPRVDAICPRTGIYTVVAGSGTSVRCLRRFDKDTGHMVLIASILPKGTEPTYFSGRYFGYLGLILFLGLVLAWTLYRWILAPFYELREISIDFLERLRSGSFSDGRSDPREKQIRFRSALFSDDYKTLVTDSYTLLNQLKSWVTQSELRWAQLLHEIKTPLAILGNQLSDWSERRNAPESSQSVVIDRAEIEKLKTKLVDLVQFADRFRAYIDLENSPVLPDDLSSVDVKSACIKVVDDLRGISDRVTVDFREDPFRVLAQPTDIEHLFQNLLLNALKYSQGRVTLSSKQFGIVCVRDQGPGVPSEVLARLGEPFNRSQSGPTAVPIAPGSAGSGGILSHDSGQGLGLSIVSAICKRYGWVLRYRFSSGSEFEVDFSSAILNKAGP